ncbi:MAG: hypothetical protein ABJB47_04785 [Actinomycetota bacterium]
MTGQTPSLQVRIGDLCARYDSRWKIDGIVAPDAMYTAQRRGRNGRLSGPVLRASDVADLACQLEQAEMRNRNSAGPD